MRMPLTTIKHLSNYSFKLTINCLDVVALAWLNVVVETDANKPTNERTQTMQNENETDLELGDDLVIKKQTRRDSSGGTWVIGSLHGHNFNALVFPGHAENAEWEIGNSKISKLWIQRMSDRTTVFNWDRGADVAATDDTAKAIVAFLCAGLAEHTYAE